MQSIEMLFLLELIHREKYPKFTCKAGTRGREERGGGRGTGKGKVERGNKENLNLLYRHFDQAGGLALSQGTLDGVCRWGNPNRVGGSRIPERYLDATALDFVQVLLRFSG
jgi:hypothetical protein